MGPTRRRPRPGDEARVPLRPDEVIGGRVESRWHTRAGRALAGLVRRTRDWAGANAVLATMLGSSAGVLALAGWGVGELYRGVKDDHGLALLDQPVLDWMIGVRTPAANAAVSAFTDVGAPGVQPWLLAPVALGLAWAWRSWTPPVLCTLAYAGADLLSRVGKDVIGRARPPAEAAIGAYQVNSSFPSGHTVFGVVVAGMTCYLLLHWVGSRPARVACVVLAAAYALAVGLSRVYLGQHWLTDVVVGWLLGLAWLWVLITLHRLWLTARRRHGEQRFGVRPDA